jgi:hypothetical protein
VSPQKRLAFRDGPFDDVGKELPEKAAMLRVGADVGEIDNYVQDAWARSTGPMLTPKQ